MLLLLYLPPICQVQHSCHLFSWPPCPHEVLSKHHTNLYLCLTLTRNKESHRQTGKRGGRSQLQSEMYLHLHAKRPKRCTLCQAASFVIVCQASLKVSHQATVKENIAFQCGNSYRFIIIGQIVHNPNIFYKEMCGLNILQTTCIVPAEKLRDVMGPWILLRLGEKRTQSAGRQG